MCLIPTLKCRIPSLLYLPVWNFKYINCLSNKVTTVGYMLYLSDSHTKMYVLTGAGASGKNTTDVCMSVHCTLSPSQVPSWNIVCTMNSEEVNISLGSTLKLLCKAIRYKILILINCKIREQSS